jgi:hypothetical protein
MKALGIAATGMLAQQTNVDVISNNIANANTTGFKTSRAAFQDLIYASVSREGALTSEQGTATPTGIDVGLGVQAAGTVRLNTQGGLSATENSLDLAIDGAGYFRREHARRQPGLHARRVVPHVRGRRACDAPGLFGRSRHRHSRKQPEVSRSTNRVWSWPMWLTIPPRRTGPPDARDLHQRGRIAARGQQPAGGHRRLWR